jgi:hypothetical protein
MKSTRQWTIRNADEMRRDPYRAKVETPSTDDATLATEPERFELLERGGIICTSL